MQARRASFAHERELSAAEVRSPSRRRHRRGRVAENRAVKNRYAVPAAPRDGHERVEFPLGRQAGIQETNLENGPPSTPGV